jgi:hypothetical protein
MESSLLSILSDLCSNEIEMVLVGGLAAVLQGTPIQTYGVDIVFSQEEGNVSRLLKALESLDAVFRIQPTRRLRPNNSHLRGDGHLNLLTKHGPLDLLTCLGENLRYRNLLPVSKPMQIGSGLSINVLTLPALIEIKERLGGEKDLAMLPLLRRTLSQSGS